MNTAVLQPLLELLKVENAEDLTDAEIVRFREWLREAYERADQGIAEPESMADATPLKPIEVQSSGQRAHPNPDALAAIYDRMNWFYARRERDRRLQAENSPAGTADHAASLSSVIE